MNIKTIRRSLKHVLSASLLLMLIAGAVTVHAAFPGANGKIAFDSNRDGNPEIYAMNADGSGQTNLTNNPANDAVPAWSPDGSKIAFISFRDDVNGEIYVMNADGSNVTRLTNNPTQDGYTSWSPSGTKIAFMSDRDGNPEIYVMNADGSGQTRLTNNAAEDHYPAWSPDDTKIAFTSHRDGNYEIYVMNADGSGQTNLSNNPASESSANWSPDGSKITFTSTRDGNFEIYVMNADGSGQTNLSNNSAFDGEPAWSPDGTKIVFDSSRDGNPEIYMMNADGSGQANLSNNPASEDTPDWQPLSTTTPFASFTAKVEIKLGPDANDDKFEVKSTLTLGNGSNGIAPLTEEVRLRVGTFTTTIPAGSFMQDTKGRLKFEGVIDGVALEAVLRPLGGGLYEFKAEGENANLTGTANPVPVELKIGDDSGNITVNAEFEDD